MSRGDKGQRKVEHAWEELSLDMLRERGPGSTGENRIVW